MVRRKQTYKRQINGKWYISKFGDVRIRKKAAQEEAKRLRGMGWKCVVIPDRLGWRLFMRPPP